MVTHSTQPGSRGNDLVMFDLETSGLDPRVHEILEIGAVRLTADLQEIKIFSTKVLPSHLETAMPEALAVNGYSPERWRDAVPLAGALADFCAFGAGGMLAGYNITFDWEFLHSAMTTLGLADPFHYHRLDVFSVAFEDIQRRGGVSRLDLASVAAAFGIPSPPVPHQALADAQTTVALLWALRRSHRG